MPIRDRDNGADAFLKNMIKKAVVHVGVQGSKADSQHGKSGLTVADVASFHEFGLGNNPKRSFIADTFDEKQAQLQKQLNRAAARIRKTKGLRARQELEKLGLFFQGLIQERIAEGIDPPLNPATIKRKGSSKPLIDTGQLRSSITYEVEITKGGGGRG
jgi:hypothetical protein